MNILTVYIKMSEIKSRRIFMNNTIHGFIRNEYDLKQKKAVDKLDFKKSEAYIKIPRLSEIENEIALVGVKYNKAILFANSATKEPLSELASTLNKLKQEKENLLINSGYKKDFLELEFECDKCKDTGFIEETGSLERCSCYRQRLIDHMFRASNVKLSDSENFSSFDESLYPDGIDENRFGISISPRENILEIKQRALAFIENFSASDERNLFFSGPTGVGKTFMSNCIASELLNRGITVLYQTSPILFNTINEYKRKAFQEDDFQDNGYKNIFEVELLIIDDLGTEPWSAARYAEFLNILNVRQVNGITKPCKTIISTNIGIKELYEYYDERVASRIIGGFDMYRFCGNDLRIR
jgi:DNA replication protein DnaC